MTKKQQKVKQPFLPYFLVGLVIILGLGLLYANAQDAGGDETINSYEECVAAGNPILESYPEQCITEDGRGFTRQLTPEEQLRLDDATAECLDLCGDGECAEVVCQGTGCPCAETPTSCSQDCK